MNFEEFNDDPIIREELFGGTREEISTQPISESSKNDCYLLQGPSSAFVLKRSPKYALKESKVYQLMKKYSLGNTLNLVFSGDDFFVTEYNPDLEPCKDFSSLIRELSRLHVRGLEVSLESSQESLDPDLKNNNRRKAISRVRRHPDLVSKYYRGVDGLVDYMLSVETLISNQRRVFVHGDVRPSNLCKDSNGGFVYMDFELGVIDFPSWDLARAIFGVDLDVTKQMIEKYISSFGEMVKEREIGIVVDEDLLRNQICADFVFKFTGVGIGVQQHPYFKDHVPRYLSGINVILKDIIENGI